MSSNEHYEMRSCADVWMRVYTQVHRQSKTMDNKVNELAHRKNFQINKFIIH